MCVQLILDYNTILTLSLSLVMREEKKKIKLNNKNMVIRVYRTMVMVIRVLQNPTGEATRM